MAKQLPLLYTTDMQTLFIADIHLNESQPQITDTFLNFLEKEARTADSLYILGDLFEVWIGDDNQTAFNIKIMRALKHLTESGVPLFIMPGNRDFLLGKQFIKATGCQLLNDPTIINLYGHSILLTHGDILCNTDFNYRKIVHNTFLQKLFLLLPIKLRQWIATKIRQKSQSHVATIPKSTIATKTVEQLMDTYQANHLIHGHFHQANIHQFTKDNKHYSHISLGAWETGSSILIYAYDKNKLTIDIKSI